VYIAHDPLFSLCSAIALLFPLLHIKVWTLSTKATFGRAARLDKHVTQQTLDSTSRSRSPDVKLISILPGAALKYLLRLLLVSTLQTGKVFAGSIKGSTP
jgi:hypothetical protein